MNQLHLALKFAYLFSWGFGVLGFWGFLGSCFSLGNIVFEVLVRFPFQKYITSWIFSGFSCSRAISGMGWVELDGLDLCVGLFYEHRFAVLIIVIMVKDMTLLTIMTNERFPGWQKVVSQV